MHRTLSRNATIHVDFEIPQVSDEIRSHSPRHIGRLEAHINPLAATLAALYTTEIESQIDAL